ncbi:MAG: hypothetical protein ACTHQQ_10975 [Solirubrobacteraceae bacterium]
MSVDDHDDDLTPAELRLSEHLELLRASPPTAAPELIARIIQRARWQGAIRDPMVFTGVVVAAIGEALVLLSGPPAGSR